MVSTGILPSTTTQRTRGTATAADVAHDERLEVVNGEIVPKASPSFEHGFTQGCIAAALGGFRGRPRGDRPGGWWLGASVEIELETHEVYVPDLAGWRIDRHPEAPHGKPVRIIPDWVCEVLSDSTMARDLGHKLRTCHRAGVGHYWAAEPAGKVLVVYRWHEAGYLVVLSAVPGEVMRVEPFDAMEMDIAVFFGAEPAREP